MHPAGQLICKKISLHASRSPRVSLTLIALSLPRNRHLEIQLRQPIVEVHRLFATLTDEILEIACTNLRVKALHKVCDAVPRQLNLFGGEDLATAVSQSVIVAVLEILTSNPLLGSCSRTQCDDSKIWSRYCGPRRCRYVTEGCNLSIMSFSFSPCLEPERSTDESDNRRKVTHFRSRFNAFACILFW